MASSQTPFFLVTGAFAIQARLPPRRIEAQKQASYNASKAGVEHLTKSLAVEWADLGIRVNAISPGYIATEMTGTVREDWRQAWEGMIPFGRMGTPEELAGAVIYLLSDAATYTSGANIIIDGCFTVV